MTRGTRTVLDRPEHARLVVAITALRATLAYGIGTALIGFGQGEDVLIGFMGLYWLASGLFSLAWARKGPFLQRLSLIAGVVGVVSGSFFVLYAVFGKGEPPAALIVAAVATVIGLTGVLHVTGGFMVGERLDRWPTGHLLLGLLELILAAVLLLAPYRLDLLDTVAAAWAFSAGSVLAFDALRARRRWITGAIGRSTTSGS
jgi:hypothetical protein